MMLASQHAVIPDAWLDEAADALDEGYGAEAADLIPQLGTAGLFRAGVPTELGGTGGEVADAMAAIAAVSARSLTAGFVFWGQRTFIEYLLQSPNTGLRERLLPDLLAGRLAGATGLSNAMKFLSGLEELQIAAAREDDGFCLRGRLPWVTNLRPDGFQVAAAVAHPSGAFVAALPHDAAGLSRTPDLQLIAMRGSATAALHMDDVRIGPEHVLHPHAARWLPQVRPAFLGLQCAMSVGLASRALQEAKAQAGAARHVLRDSIATLEAQLAASEAALVDGLRRQVFQATAAPLFEIRIALAGIAAEALSLELQASGGRAYLSAQGKGFARRWREAAFLPVVTPSLVQLKAALAGTQSTHAAGRAA